MPDLHTPGVPDARNPAAWRGQHARLFDFAARHTFTTAQLAHFFAGGTLETRRKYASRWLVKQRRRKRIRVIGIVQRRDTGRPEIAYGRFAKYDQIEHEIFVAEL